jgi:tetratricopeptide (TPR) repeat protein
MAGVLALGACAHLPPAYQEPPALQLAGPAVQIDDVDVLEMSPAMKEFLQKYILRYKDKHTRMTLLMNAVSGNGVLGFDYDESLTLTSVEAFELRAGNCIAFANMMVAMARYAGLRAQYQEVIRQPEWTSRDDTVLLIKHINVVLESLGYVYVMDVSGIKMNPNHRRRVIGDSYAKALYLNNIGAEALLKNDLPTAHAYMAKAIETEHLLTDSWVNMGVLLSRNEQLDDAAWVLNMALQIDDNENAALSNLYEVYIAQEDLESAADLENKVERYRQRNPYYLLYLSEEALLEDRYDESARLLQRAIRKKDDDHLLHFAVAKTHYLLGDMEAAQSSLLQALELAPESMVAHYNRPLGELVEEAVAKAEAEALAEALEKEARAR